MIKIVMHDQREDAHSLLIKIAEKDRQAFSLFYDRFSSLAYTFAMRILRSRPEAEDLVQEVFLQVWNQAASFDPKRGKPEAWLITITKSRAIDKIRSRRRKEQGTPVFEEIARVKTMEAGGDALAHAEQKWQVEGAMAELSGIQKTALEMAYFEGKTQTEIARELGVPVGTIKTRIRDGLLKLRQQFTQQGKTV